MYNSLQIIEISYSKNRQKLVSFKRRHVINHEIKKNKRIKNNYVLRRSNKLLNILFRSDKNKKGANLQI